MYTGLLRFIFHTQENIGFNFSFQVAIGNSIKQRIGTILSIFSWGIFITAFTRPVILNGSQTPGGGMMSSQESREGLKKCYGANLELNLGSPWP